MSRASTCVVDESGYGVTTRSRGPGNAEGPKRGNAEAFLVNRKSEFPNDLGSMVSRCGADQTCRAVCWAPLNLRVCLAPAVQRDRATTPVRSCRKTQSRTRPGGRRLSGQVVDKAEVHEVMTVKDAEIKAFARYVNGQRPEWGEVGIVTALRKALREHPWLAVEHKMLDTAADGQARTPEALNHADAWNAPRPSSGPVLTATFCPTCGRTVVKAVTHHCRPGDSARGVSLLRSALAKP